MPNGLKVATAALGAMNFGTGMTKEESYAVLDRYVELGGNFIDTSNNYAHWAGTGDESETVLGQWLKERGGRDSLVIATKVGFDRHGEGAGLKKEQIEYWVDESLRKLNTEYIDLYYAHTDDPDTPIEETMEAVGGVVEGYYAAESIHQLAEREGVEMPICRCAYEVLYKGKQARDVVGELMGRAKKDELLERTWM